MADERRRMALTGNKRMADALFLVIAAFLLMMLATRSSFLYPCNDWNDANSYFSVGKALFHGKMPYRDVFDQKGMYLYFLYGLAYLISHTTFIGVFLLEVILAIFDLFGICRILQLYVKRNTALLLSPLVLAVTVSSFSFYWGGSAEEVCLPFLIWGLYDSLHYFKNGYPNKKVEWKVIFINGLLAGIVANIKFTSLGFFFAWMMCMAFSFLAMRDFWGAVKGCVIFLSGMAVPFIPWVIYFGINHGLYEWYWGYVYINVFMYSNLNGEGPGLYERIYTLSKLLYWVVRKNMIYFVFLIPGVLWEMCGRRKKWLERFNLLALCFFLFLGIYVGGSELPYYALPLSVFTVLGFGLLGQGAERIMEKVFHIEKEKGGDKRKKITDNPVMVHIAGGLVTALGLGIIWLNSMNIPHMQEKKEDIFLYKFKEIVEQTPDPTLLNIGCLDAGLYTVCDIVPTCRWFQTQTVGMDEVLKEQERYLKEGWVDYCLARDSYPEVIWENYELVGEEPWYQDGQAFTYYLFRRKEEKR
ncbi:hypothetical protein [Parablautia muri]|uniref:Uncharacterized protein n=1 Tax=Parablautia muri TaxID=2320879 RepID=A0A9X5GRP2_9FIRM|nr:hypothetical protein [Parablautia muri]NBJ92260.1 hypothetical protein [Parablautia muri]